LLLEAAVPDFAESAEEDGDVQRKRGFPSRLVSAEFLRPQGLEQEHQEPVGIAPSGANLDTLVEDWLEPPILGSSDGLILEFVMHFHAELSEDCPVFRILLHPVVVPPPSNAGRPGCPGEDGHDSEGM